MFSKEIINFFLLPLYVLSALKCSHCEAQRGEGETAGISRSPAFNARLIVHNFYFIWKALHVCLKAIDKSRAEQFSEFPSWRGQCGMPVTNCCQSC